MRDRILSVLESIYGPSIYGPILADELTEKIPSWEGDPIDKDSERERKIRLRIWDFFSGGSTAEVAAHRIKMALYEAGEWS